MSFSTLVRLGVACFSVVGAVALAGCSGALEPAEVTPGEVDETTEELTATGRSFVGTYATHRPTFEGFLRLDLRANGQYDAVSQPGAAMCVDCDRRESGRFSVARVAGRTELRLRPAGRSRIERYDATKSGSTLSLRRAGETQVLAKLSAGQCHSKHDCGGDACAPVACPMFCSDGDPSCCPGVCDAPASSCFGAWVDQFGGCRAPNDGALPASCCAAPASSCFGAWVDQFGGCRAPNDGVLPASCCR
jgi:hypothetical protein